MAKSTFCDIWLFPAVDAYLPMMQDVITSHRAKLDPDNPKDVIDEYLVAMDKKSDIAAHFSGELPSAL